MTAPDATWSIDELLQRCIAEAIRDEEDDEAYWQVVHLLQRADAKEVWARLEPLAEHARPQVRALVPDVLRYLAQGAQPRRSETLVLFERMLRDAPAPTVIQSIGIALGELAAPEGVALMLPFTHHDDPEVRFAVVSACLAQRDPRAIHALIELSRDPAEHVRDWATFGLGTQVGPAEGEESSDVVDTEALRQALVARLDDPHDHTRCEAIVGLAARRDPRVLPVLEREIARGPEFSLILEAARWFASPALCEGLRQLEAHEDVELRKFWNDNGLARAIEACCAGCPK